MMRTYCVGLKNRLNEHNVVSFTIRAYNTTQLVDMLGDFYYIVSVEEVDINEETPLCK